MGLVSTEESAPWEYTRYCEGEYLKISFAMLPSRKGKSYICLVGEPAKERGADDEFRAKESVNNMSLRSVGITVKAGEQMLCTFVTQRRVNLQAIKFNDLNADGMRQANEPTLTPWEFRFYKSDGTLINHKVTDANGSAVQINVIPGSFKVCETPKAGWTNTLSGQVDPLLGLSCYNLTVPPGGNASLLFGNTQASVVRPAQEFDSLSGVAMGELSDINEPESEKPVGERSQSIYLPLINR